MRVDRRTGLFTAVSLLVVAAAAHAAVEVTPGIQAELDRQKKIAAGWAADPVIVKAVAEQNAKGPLAGMDNSKWKLVRRSDPLVRAFQSNPAGQFLRSKMEASGGLITEAFVSAAQGEKVAFAEKTTSYIHKGMPKFDVPFTSRSAWQGRPEFDESAQTYQIQISVPVLVDGQPAGALVVGISLSQLERPAEKAGRGLGGGGDERAAWALATGQGGCDVRRPGPDHAVRRRPRLYGGLPRQRRPLGWRPGKPPTVQP